MGMRRRAANSRKNRANKIRAAKSCYFFPLSFSLLGRRRFGFGIFYLENRQIFTLIRALGVSNINIVLVLSVLKTYLGAIGASHLLVILKVQSISFYIAHEEEELC